MIGLPAQIRVWAFPGPCDMRKGHNGLLGLVERHFCRDILGGDLFLFVNRRRTLAKTLYWDGSGYDGSRGPSPGCGTVTTSTRQESSCHRRSWRCFWTVVRSCPGSRCAPHPDRKNRLIR